MQAEQSRGCGAAFFKGISLSEYMRDMNCPEEQMQCEQTYDQSNDLEIQCHPKITNYAIREIDEDNYDESLEQHLIIEPLYTYDLQRSRIIKIQENSSKKINHKKNQQKIKDYSNALIKDMANPKKEMFRSLYGHSFASSDTKDAGHLLSTLGMNNWRGKHKSLNRKQMEQRSKNRRQYEQIIKYENVISQKFDSKLHSIRIDGIKDKIHERGTERPHHKIKQ